MTLRAVVVVLALLAVARPAQAAKGLRCFPAPSKVILDGVPDEWIGESRKLVFKVKGDPGDAEAEVLLAHDDQFLYFTATVTDSELVGGGDHLELHLGIPGSTVATFAFYPGVPGKSKARVTARGRPVRGGAIVEAPRPGGYSLEAKVPWSAVPKSSTVRIGYRGVVQLHDADGSQRPRAILGSAKTERYGEMPPLSMPAEVALGSGLLRQRNIQTPPVHNLMANVWGDRMLERVLVYDRFLVVLGPNYRDGKQYYFRDLAADADRGLLPQFEVRDLTGDRRDDILLRRRLKGSEGEVEAVEVLSYHGGDETPQTVFAHEVKLMLAAGGTIENRVEVSGSGSRTRITVHAGKDRGMDRARFDRQSNTGGLPVLVPWGAIASQTHEVKNGAFVIGSERSQKPEPVAAAQPDPARPAPSPRPASPKAPSTSAKMKAVYDLYKKKAKVSGRARFDISANFAGDRGAERLVVHRRDLVLFGPGIRDGRAFAAITLSAFATDGDLKRVESRDVTGDGRHEIIVHGVVRAKMPDDLGGGDLLREVVYIYTLRRGQLERVFGAELGRVVGKKSVRAKLELGRGKLTLKPGRARGYDERSYPWRQKTEPEDSGFEPLVLPWGGVDRVRLAYDGKRFKRDG